MHTQEVDLAHPYLIPIHHYSHRDASHECEEVVLRTPANTDKPVFVIAWWREGPSQKRDLVVKPQSRITVLNVMVGQQLVKVLWIFLVHQINFSPIKIRWQSIRFFANIGDCLDTNWSIKEGVREDDFICWLRYGLCLPKFVSGEEWRDVLQLVCNVLYFSALVSTHLFCNIQDYIFKVDRGVV